MKKKRQKSVDLKIKRLNLGEIYENSKIGKISARARKKPRNFEVNKKRLLFRNCANLMKPEPPNNPNKKNSRKNPKPKKNDLKSRSPQRKKTHTK